VPALPPDGTVFSIKPRKAVPDQFVLDAIAALSPTTRRMFGCLAV
jgi:predicted component of type VI protein secretion system